MFLVSHMMVMEKWRCTHATNPGLHWRYSNTHLERILTAVPKLDPTTLHEVIGIWQSISGNFDMQLQKLLYIASDYDSLLLNGFLCFFRHDQRCS